MDTEESRERCFLVLLCLLMKPFDVYIYTSANKFSGRNGCENNTPLDGHGKFIGAGCRLWVLCALLVFAAGFSNFAPVV